MSPCLAPACLLCPGEGTPLSSLGTRTWFHCRRCGLDFRRTRRFKRPAPPRGDATGTVGMSRHFLHVIHQGRKLTVVAGYDRPLRALFLQVIHDDEAPTHRENVFVYDSLGNPSLDWTDINTVADQLAALGIEPPASLVEGLFLDQCFNAGSRVVEHHDNRPPAVLHAG